MADILIKSSTTDENGVVSFAGLPPGTYKYVQTSARTGYTADSQTYSITVDSATPIDETRTNTPTECGSITIKKHVENYPDFKLAGATFKLMDADGKTMKSVTDASGTDGEILLDNLMSITDTPQTYKIVEVTNPTGYEPNTTEFEPSVTVGENTEQAVPNTPTVQGTLNVDLNDTNYSEYGLEGSDYDLYYVEP